MDTAAYIIPGHVRVSLHWYWANDCRLYPQRRLRFTRQSPGDHNASLILRRHDPIQPN